MPSTRMGLNLQSDREVMSRRSLRVCTRDSMTYIMPGAKASVMSSTVVPVSVCLWDLWPVMAYARVSGKVFFVRMVSGTDAPWYGKLACVERVTLMGRSPAALPFHSFLNSVLASAGRGPNTGMS